MAGECLVREVMHAALLLCVCVYARVRLLGMAAVLVLLTPLYLQLSGCRFWPGRPHISHTGKTVTVCVT